MRNKKTLSFPLLLFSLICCWFSNPLNGQERINISVGIGLAEFINVGVKFQAKQAQIGFGFGCIPLKNESLLSFTADYFYHFAGSASLSDRRPWYGRMGLDFVRDETINFIDITLLLNLRIGRDFNISKKIGIEIDGGANVQLFHDTIRKEAYQEWNIEFPVIPAFGITLFYRL